MSTSPARVTYRFGEFEVDAAAFEVRRGTHRISLARQPMDLLLLLLERRQELVSREEMATRLWGSGVFTDPDAGIHTAILKIRQVLGDSRESPRFVETVPGRGYRFVAPVDVVSQSHPQASLALVAAPESLPDLRRHNLPAEFTSFVGRRKELLELPGVLASSRLLSLTGAGGVGKTRLAVRLAADLVSEFPDGVWLVDLAPLSVPDLVAQTIATALGVREGPQRSARDALLDTLRDRELLLVLDTCEHLIASCAELVEALLRGAPALRILATSREALGVSGETVCRVPSLSLPEALASVPVDALLDSDATQLFIERARAADPDFKPTPDNADAIARICRRLDGIPLAIELAAARIVVLSPEQIEARLQDRFRLLTGGARTAVARTPLGSPVPRAVAVVVRGPKVLVIKRRLDGREYAVLPGGGIEPGESAAEAAVRELAEECSLEGIVVRHLFDGHHGGRSASYFLVDVSEGEPVLGGSEAEAHAPEDSYQPLWATAPELELLGLLPEEIIPLVVDAGWPLTVSAAGAGDWPVIEALWQLYQHDLSEFRHSAPGPDGTFGPGHLTPYAGRTDRIAYLARLGEVPCGFALVRGLAEGRTRRMGEFFVTRSARGRGVARGLARRVVTAHPGRWEIPFQNENQRAAAFWRRFAAQTMSEVSERTIPVPGKQHLPDDVWLAGTVGHRRRTSHG